ncbi:MAG: hypothetical protein KGO82_18545, partial [Bacteroidota bacterium]|nr:hypothetical protein [Bacteroidota bacterium]
PVDQREEDFKGSLFLEDSLKSSRDLLSDIFIPLLENYAFYAERHLKKEEVIEKAVSVLDRSKRAGLCDLVDSLNRFIVTELREPHFYIKSACYNRKAEKTAMYVFPIQGRQLVAGVFDDSLSMHVPLGSELTEVNGQEITKEDLNPKDVNALLKGIPGKQVHVTIRPEGQTARTVSYVLKDKYRIPAGFSPANFDFRYLNDSVAYYKISKINPELPLDFASRLDSINGRAKLILDFRNNGGGDFLAGAEFLSFIIGHKFTYFDFEAFPSGHRDSVVVRENATPFHYRPDGKLVLLVDGSTACIAELVVYTLKTRYKNVVVVGREHSRGALAFIYEINFPKDNIVVATNCLDTGKFLLGGQSIEGKGIKPDIPVEIQSVLDLQPYQDKVLKVAISQ